MTSDEINTNEIDALAEQIKRRHAGAPHDMLAAACAVIIGENVGSVDPEEQRSHFAGLIERAWAASGLARAANPGQDQAAAHLMGMLDDLYHGLLVNIVQDGSGLVLLNAWLSVHLNVTIAIFGAEKAAKFLRAAARGLPGAIEARDALVAMDELATHGAGRA